MAKVICTLPNASASINGVRFVTHKLGMISEEIDDDAAKAFTSIHGYHLHDSKTGGIVAPSGAPLSTTEPAQAQTVGLPAKASPESLAAAAASLSAEDHSKLLDLLMDQEASRSGKTAAGAPASATSVGGVTPSAPAPSGGGAPPSSSKSKPAAAAKSAAPGDGTPNPSF